MIQRQSEKVSTFTIPSVQITTNNLSPKGHFLRRHFHKCHVFTHFNLSLGKLKKQRSYEHNSVFEAVMLSIENLNEYHKKLYKQLAVFLDDVGIPPKVNECLFLRLFFGYQKSAEI